jgi:hypothetical protein
MAGRRTSEGWRVTLGITVLTVRIAPPDRAVDALQPFFRHDSHQRGRKFPITSSHSRARRLDLHSSNRSPPPLGLLSRLFFFSSLLANLIVRVIGADDRAAFHLNRHLIL